MDEKRFEALLGQATVDCYDAEEEFTCSAQARRS